ncbi:MAG: imidazolonepropionase [bacterium]
MIIAMGTLNILHNIGTLHTFSGGPKRKEALSDTGEISDAALVWDESGRIIEHGVSEDFLKKYRYADATWLDAGGRIVTPGLIDSHTHSVNAGSRANEFVMRCAGVDYMKILENGGGILNSADRTRESSIGHLMETGRLALDRSLGFGVTTLEAKSGYGLNTEAELKMLRAIQALDMSHEIDLKATFLGAHAIPREFKDNPESYVDLIVGDMLPKIADENLADYCDVFIEKGVYSVEQGRRILEAGIKRGLKPKVHVDEIESLGGIEMCVGLGALSVDHLIAITDSDIEKLAASNTVGCLLPGTSFFLKKSYAPCRRMIDAGCILALATDNNPGSSRTENIQWILTVACLHYGLKPQEAFGMVTINAAAALGLQSEIGSIEKGKRADFVIWQTDNLEEIPYHHGISHVGEVYIKGKRVFESL